MTLVIIAAVCVTVYIARNIIFAMLGDIAEAALEALDGVFNG